MDGRAMSEEAALQSPSDDLTLHCAAAEGDLERVKKLIEKSQYGPEHKTPDGITPLHCASCCGMLEVVKYLVDHLKCNPSPEDNNGECPLVYSAYCVIKDAELRSPLDRYMNFITEFRFDHIRVALFLLQCERTQLQIAKCPKLVYVLRLPLTCKSLTVFSQMIDILKVEENDTNELVSHEMYTYMKTLIGGEYSYPLWDFVQKLLDSYPKCLKLAMETDAEHTHVLFNRAFKKASASVVKSFLLLGVYKPTVELVKEAIKRNDTDVVRYLIESALNIDQSNTNHWASLLLYVLSDRRYLYGDFDKRLIEWIATMFKDTDIKDPDNGNTPLHLACVCFNKDLCCSVIPLLSTSYQKVQNLYGRLPLHIACYSEYANLESIKLVSSLPELDVNTVDNNGNTPIHKLCSFLFGFRISPEELQSCFIYLIKDKKCDISKKNGDGELPLHTLLKHGLQSSLANYTYASIKICSVGVCVNTQDNEGNTPLHIACKANDYKTVMYLTSTFSCDTNLLNSEGHPPLYYALSSNMPADAIKAVSAGCTQITTDIIVSSESTTLRYAACNNEHALAPHGLSYPSDFHESEEPQVDICSLCKHEQNIDQLKFAATMENVNQRSRGDMPIHVACAHNNVMAVKLLIEVLHCDLSCIDSKGKLPIHIASSNSLECVKLIASSCQCINDDVNVRDNEGNTPLHLALIHKRLDIAKYLLTNFKCNTQLKNNDEELPIYFASGTSVDIFEMIVKHSDAKVDINYQSITTGGTLLHFACQAGVLEIVRYLVKTFECKPSMKIRDREGRLPVDYACKHSLEMVKLVCQSCTAKDFIPTKRDESMSSQYYAHISTLDVACFFGSLDIVKYFINEKGLDLSALENNHGPLFCACGMVKDIFGYDYSKEHFLESFYDYIRCHVYPDVIKYLITECDYNPGASVSWHYQSHYHSAFEYACEKQSLYLIEALTVLSVDQTDDKGNTLLHYACMFDCIDIVKFLVDKECDQSIFNKNGEMAMHFTCSRKSQTHALEILKLLTKCNLKLPNANGDTLLHIASSTNICEVVHYLVTKKNFDIYIQNNKGESPLHIASRGSPEVAFLLTGFRCDVNCQDKDGNTPLHIACLQINHNDQCYPILCTILFTSGSRADIPNKHGELALHKMMEPIEKSKFTKLVPLSPMIKPIKGSKDSKSMLSIHKSQSNITVAFEMVIRKYSEGIHFANNDGFTPVHLAINSGQINFFNALVNIQFDFSGKIGSDFVHIASEYRQPEIVKWLIEHGADPTLADKDGNLPQHLCFLGEKDPCIQTLKQLGNFNIFIQNNNGDTVVHLACRNKNPEFLRELLKSTNRFCSSALSVQNNDKNTALHLAASASVEHVRVVASPENVNMQNNKRDTPLHVACQCKNNFDTILYMMNELQCSLEIVNNDGDSPFHILLGHKLQYHVDPLLQYIPKSICDRENNNGETLLYIACKERHVSTISYLSQKMKCKAVCNSNGATPMHFLCHTHNLGIVDSILSQVHVRCHPCAQITDTLSLPNDDQFATGDTVLHVACRHGNSKLVAYLLNRNHDKALSISNTHNEIPFHLACRHDKTIVEAFIDHITKFNCNAVNSSGDTPLHVACRYPFNYAPDYVEPVITLLVDTFKCKTNLLTKDNELPLHLACRHLVVSNLIIEKLTTCLSDGLVSSQNDVGDTPLHILFKSCRNEFYERKSLLAAVELIVKRMPSLDIDNHENKQPLHLACQYQSLAMVQYLIKQYNIKSLKAPAFILHAACHNDDPAVIKYSIEHFGHEVNIPNADGDLPLHIALCHGSKIPITYSLIKRTKDINATNNQGNTPLHELCILGKEPLCSCNDPVRKYIPKYGSILFNEESAFKNDFDELLKILEKGTCDKPENVNIPSYKQYLLTILLNFEELKLSLSRQNQRGQTPLHCICIAGDYDELQTIFKPGVFINANVQDNNGFTILHFACQANHVESVKLILSWCVVNPSIEDNAGQTPITLTSSSTIVKLLIEHGADPQPLYEMHRTFFVSEKPPPTPLKLLVIGNASVGKTTLIHSLQSESYDSIIPANFDRTAGIVLTKFSSSIYGDVAFYDFAGQPEYYASHDAVIHRIIKNVPPIVLLLVNLKDTNMRITEQIHYWINFMENRFDSTLTDKAHLIIVCSHSDVLKSEGKDPSKKVSELTKKIKSQFDGKMIMLRDNIHMNCTRPHSKEMERLQQMLKRSTDELQQEGVLHFNSHCFYVFLYREFKDSNYITLACIISKLRLQTTQPEGNPLHLLPSDQDKVIEFCQDLNDRGHIHFIQHPTVIERSWIVLDEQPLLHELLGSLFAPENFPKHRPLSYSTGVVPLSLFKKHFSEELNCSATMLLTFLSRMEYCREITDEEVIESVVKQEGYYKSERYFFFPNLVSLDRPNDKWRNDSNVTYQCGWLIQCTRKGEFFSPHFIQALLLRLVFLFTTKRPDYDSGDIETADDFEDESKQVMDVVIKRKCSVWKNGVYWQESSGVKTIIDIFDQRNLLLLMNCQTGSEMSLIERRSMIISMVFDAKEEFCTKAHLLEFFLHPKYVKHPLIDIDRTQLFSVPSIKESISQGQPSIVNDHDHLIIIEELLHFEPYAELGGDVLELLHSQRFLQSQVNDRLLTSIAEQLCHRYPLLLKSLCPKVRSMECLSHSSNVQKSSQLKRILRERFCEGTFKDVCNFFDQISIFRGRKPPSIIGMFNVTLRISVCIVYLGGEGWNHHASFLELKT